MFKFDPNHRVILQVGPDVIGYQDKAHGMAVDSEDNVWMTAANGATVMKIAARIIHLDKNGNYWVMDKQDNLYAGDTSVGRVTKMVAPKK